jgi:hypothetical protein
VADDSVVINAMRCATEGQFITGEGVRFVEATMSGSVETDFRDLAL